MKTLQLLTVTFDTSIAPHEVEAFRGAVIERAGLQYDLYHNHNNAPDARMAYHYRYPLIQYKRLYRRPAILFIEKGIDAASHLFARLDAGIIFGNTNKSLKFQRKQLQEYRFGVSGGQWHYYTLMSWMALNSENYRKFLLLKTFTEQKELLERLLANHIISFAKHIDHRLEFRFDVQILELLKEEFVPFEGVQVLTFNLHFRTQVLLPLSIGLGKAVSVGYGIIRQWQPDNYDF